MRLWTVRQGDRLIWRASLEDPQSGTRLGFAGLHELVQYVEAQVAGIETGECLEREQAHAQDTPTQRRCHDDPAMPGPEPEEARNSP
jgi:hypothetical protein